MTSRQYCLNSKIGKLYLVASEKGLTGVYWKKQSLPLEKSLKGSDRAAKILAQAAKEMIEYLDGQRRKFSVKLDLKGTPFQERVWKELLRIPYGKTCSYSELAVRVKNPRAVRAVGTANGKNPVCILVPCHRVIASNGQLGGYSGGLGLKARLLKLENASI